MYEIVTLRRNHATHLTFCDSRRGRCLTSSPDVTLQCQYSLSWMRRFDCRKRAEEAGVTNLEAGVEDGQELSGFPDGSVDAVTCTWGLESMPERQKAIEVLQKASCFSPSSCHFQSLYFVASPPVHSCCLLLAIGLEAARYFLRPNYGRLTSS